MPSLRLSVLDAFDARTGRLARPALEKFAGAWLACFLVMARGNIFAAFSFEHIRLASICGTVGAAVTIALLVQMDRSSDSVSRQATIIAFPAPMGRTAGHGCRIYMHRHRPLARQALGKRIGQGRQAVHGPPIAA
jgi:hypothetical protein